MSALGEENKLLKDIIDGLTVAQEGKKKEDDEQLVDYGDSGDEDEGDDVEVLYSDLPSISPRKDDDDDAGGVGGAGPSGTSSAGASGAGQDSGKAIEAEPISFAAPADDQGAKDSECIEIVDLMHEESTCDEAGPSTVAGPEEGEFVHDYTTEQLAKMFKVSLAELQASSVPVTQLPDDNDMVQLEYEDEGVEDSSQLSYDFSTLAKVFRVDSRRVSELVLEARRTATVLPLTREEFQAQTRGFYERLEDFKMFTEKYDLPPPPDSPKQISKFVVRSRSKFEGKILSWGYFHNIPGKLRDRGCYVLKRTDGVQYFGKAFDLKTLPYTDFYQLWRLKMLKPIPNFYNDIFEGMLIQECRSNQWNMLRPQFPTIVTTDQLDTRSGRPIKKLIYKKPNSLRRSRLRTMEQNWSPHFKFWFYDDGTSEAVIVLEQDSNWRVIRILDPIWLVNCSKLDIETLFDAPIFHKKGMHDAGVTFKSMAFQYRTIVKMCFALGINSGCNWEDVNDLYTGLMDDE